jgi:hypothetical protein
MKALFCI